MHSIDDQGKVCVDLQKFNDLSASIRLKDKINHLIQAHRCPQAIPNFSITFIFKSGRRFYLSNLYYWSIAYRTEGYNRGDVDHLIDIYDGKEYFIQQDMKQDAVQEAILKEMQSRYRLYTMFAMIRQCYECDLIIEAYDNKPVANPEALYFELRERFEQFIVGFLNAILPDLNQSEQPLPEYRILDFFKDPNLRQQVITRQLNAESLQVTQRELECLYLSGKGKSAKETASVLFLSPETVQSHLKSIRKKMNCSTTTQAVHDATKKQLFDSFKFTNFGDMNHTCIVE